MGTRTKKMIGIILGLGLILRCINLNQSLWLDEAINILATQKFSLLGMITEYAKSDFHPPLFFIILWGWTKVFGTGEIFVRIPSILFGLLTIYIIYVIGAKLHSRKLGLISALLLATNPLHIYYSQEARMYALACFAVSLNFFLFAKIIKNEKVSLLVLVLGNLIVLTSDYVAYLIFPAQLIFLILNKQSKAFSIWVKGFFAASIIWTVWIGVLLDQLKIGFQTSANLPAWKTVVGGFDIKAVPLTFIKFIIGRISLDNKLTYLSIIAPICLFFILLIIKGLKGTQNLFKNLLLSWLLIPIALASVFSLVIPIFSYFRLLFTLPPFLILVSLGVFSFKHRLKYLILGLILFTQITSSLIYLFNTKYQREDWKGLVGYLSSQPDKIVLFESTGVLPPFEYYAKNKITALGALKTFPARNSDDVIDIKLLTAHNIFLIDYLIDISDRKRLVKEQLLKLNAQLIEVKDFHGVGFVYHYVK